MDTVNRTQDSSSSRREGVEMASQSEASPSIEVQSEFNQLLKRKEGETSYPRQTATLTEGDSVQSESTGDFPGKVETDSGHDVPECQEGEQGGDLSSLMSSLFDARREGSSTPQKPAIEAGVPSASGAQVDMVERLVRQILVSHPDQVGDREVRLVLQDSVLPNTEIRLSRGADGLLSVSLLTDRDDAFQTLVSAQAGLKEQLSAHEQYEVRVVVTNTQGSQASDDAAGRRSAAYMAYEGDDGELSAFEKNSRSRASPGAK
jgi:type III secretion system needle length determinant